MLADRDEREDEALPEDLESLPSEFALSEVEGDYPAQEDAGIVPDEEVSPLQLEDPDPWEDTEGIAKLSDEAFDQSIAKLSFSGENQSPTVCGSHEGQKRCPPTSSIARSDHRMQSFGLSCEGGSHRPCPGSRFEKHH